MSCTVRSSQHQFTLEDAIGSHACSLDALACVRPNAIPFGVEILLPVGTVHSVQALKAAVGLFATVRTVMIVLRVTIRCAAQTYRCKTQQCDAFLMRQKQATHYPTL
jgi:hypothetical protein